MVSETHVVVVRIIDPETQPNRTAGVIKVSHVTNITTEVASNDVSTTITENSSYRFSWDLCRVTDSTVFNSNFGITCLVNREGTFGCTTLFDSDSTVTWRINLTTTTNVRLIDQVIIITRESLRKGQGDIKSLVSRECLIQATIIVVNG